MDVSGGRIVSMSAYGRKALYEEARMLRSARSGTRNAAINSAAFKLATLIPAHLSEGEVRAVLTDAAQVLSANARADDPFHDDEIASTIDSGLRAGMLSPRDVPAGFANRMEALGDLRRIGTAWHHTPMGGWQGARCKRVMPGVLRIAHSFGGPTNVPLSIARIGIESGLSTSRTIRRALTDLRQEGWLTLRGPGGPGHSARYDIHTPPYDAQDEPLITPPNTGVWEGGQSALVGHDAGRRDSLGPTGVRVFLFLVEHSGDWHKQAEVATALGVHPGTVNRLVRPQAKLIRFGIVLRNDKGQVKSAISSAIGGLDLAAELAGTAGRRDADKARLAVWYQQRGFLTEDLHWIDPTDGRRGGVARWLLPQGPDTASGEEQEQGT